MPERASGLQVVFTTALSALSTELETWLQRNLARIVAGLVLGASVVVAPAARSPTSERRPVPTSRRAWPTSRTASTTRGIEELKKAYDILPHPNVLYNIARAYVDQGDLENAVAYYKKYLEGNPKDRDEVAQIVAALEARIRKQQARAPRGAAGADAGRPGAGGPGGAAAPARTRRAGRRHAARRGDGAGRRGAGRRRQDRGRAGAGPPRGRR